MTPENQTHWFLHQISKHISGRHDCMKKEFTVIVIDNKITLSPDVYVYPTRYNRNKADKTELVQHILSYHTSEIINDISELNLVSGKYKYILSITGCKRKWVRTR